MLKVAIFLSALAVAACATAVPERNPATPQTVSDCEGLSSSSTGQTYRVDAVYWSDQLHPYFFVRHCREGRLSVNLDALPPSRRAALDDRIRSVRNGRFGPLEFPVTLLGKINKIDGTEWRVLLVEDFVAE